MTNAEFEELARVYGFAPSRSLRELVEAVEGMARSRLMTHQAALALNQLFAQEQRNGNSKPGPESV